MKTFERESDLQAAVMESEPYSQSASMNGELAPATLARDLKPRLGFQQAVVGHRGSRIWYCIAAAVALGAVGLSPAWLGLWDVWTDDPLRSIGMLIVPASLILTLRTWRQLGWEQSGTWWGLLPVVVAFLMSSLHQKIAWNFVAGPVKFDLLAPKLALYCFSCGAVLLFAGVRLWRLAWFPLGLMLFAQPVPSLSSRLVDLPLQSLSAHIARSFALLIGFAPSNHELLRLMFTPGFGMFIAPGCDGLRGAVTLGYAALIVGYLKRVSILRWISYVAGAVLMGYTFNLIRLCALVFYYRIAVGYAWLENLAKQADYAIGACLILIAMTIFLWIVSRASDHSADEVQLSAPPAASLDDIVRSVERRATFAKAATFAILALFFVFPGVFAIRGYQRSFARTVQDGDITSRQLDDLMPTKVGDYSLARAWQEDANGRITVESAAYTRPGSGEMILGVWLPPSQHSVHESWRVRGEDPLMRQPRSYSTAGGRAVPFDSAFYSDGITDSFAGNAFCTPSNCLLPNRNLAIHIDFTVDPVDFRTRGMRAVPIFFRAEKAHDGEPQAAVQQELSSEAQRFLVGVDFEELSRRFQ